MRCFICKECYKHSWYLIGHLSEAHNLSVYTTDANGEDDVAVDSAAAAGGDDVKMETKQ